MHNVVSCSGMKPLSVHNPFNDAPVYYLPQTDSTMRDAAELAAGGTPSGTVVVAGFQRAGRGRFEKRRWISAPGKGLLFTLTLDHATFANGPALTPLLAGLGVARYTEHATGRRCFVKWPNDVLCQGGKVAGILCESRDNRVFIGIGINCAEPDHGVTAPQGEAAADDLPQAATGSSKAVFPPVSLGALGASVTKPLLILEDVLAFLKRGFIADDPVREIESRLYLRGRPVTVVTGTADVCEKAYGILAGLGSNGQLLLKQPATGVVREIYSGELCVC